MASAEDLAYPRAGIFVMGEKIKKEN